MCIQTALGLQPPRLSSWQLLISTHTAPSPVHPSAHTHETLPGPTKTHSACEGRERRRRTGEQGRVIEGECWAVTCQLQTPNLWAIGVWKHYQDGCRYNSAKRYWFISQMAKPDGKAVLTEPYQCYLSSTFIIFCFLPAICVELNWIGMNWVKTFI